MRHLLKSERGAALITVTWVLLILSILAAGLLSFTITIRKDVEFEISEAKSRYIAQSAIEVFLKRYFYDEDDQFYRTGTIEVLDQRLDIQVNFEAGKVNINRAGLELISLVFAANGMSENEALELASAIIDWRDSDDTPMILGAEADQYIVAGLSSVPRNGPFESVGELQYIIGMSRDLFFCVRPLLTVYSLSSSVGQNYASPRMIDTLQWAYDNSWQGLDWGDPSANEIEQILVGNVTTLGGQALEVQVADAENQEYEYQTLIRYKTTAVNSYSIIRPLERATADSSLQHCPTG